ncbi:tail length tape measure protein [Janthinobacterium sp. 35]|uniref:phage tail length tape measure family protein n=1 Tax=Janthinobacterium sp. 35 TaxID=2035210 RepID=UPI000C18A95A|nr:phage tail length tape measure family protein [Janthinobacterium sp. 35]PIG31055.1 tail length tape measure protein [Janthinobacterium sp. 35]
MTNTIGGATIELAVDSSGVESGLDRVDGAVKRTGRTLDSLRTQGGGALDSIGNGGAAAANRVDAATRNIAGAVERANAALISGKKSGAEYFEELGRSRGADMLKLAPLIAQLRETEAAQARAKAATEAAAAAQQGAAEAARVQAAALREVAQAQAGKDSYVAGLREQIALYGKSTEEVLRYRAAQAGAAEAAGPLILQLQNMRAAHEAITESTRLEAQAQRQVAQAQANKDGFLSALREQVALHGKSAEEVLRYRAALAGAAADAEPMIQAITRMKATQEAATASAKAAADAQQAATQAQAKGDAFLISLREQVALYGKSTEEVLRYKAAQAGAANAAEPQIQKLQQLKIAQEAVTEAARLAAAAQQQAAQAQSNRDTMLAGLREQIALYGKSTEEVLRYRAAQAGAAGAAEPLIQELQRQKVAQDAVAEATRLAAAAQQQAAQQQVAGTAMVASLREQIALYGKTTEEVLRYKAAQAGVAGAAEPHIQELARLKLAEDAVTAAAKAAAEAQRQAAMAQTGRDSFVAGLQQQAAAIGKSRSELLELQAAQMGVTAQAAPFIAKLREVEQGLNHAGMSARATAAAMRGVPAQFTDIVVSIQGGQNPLTVLLQQGGQLKDMFGGLGNAAKALGGYVLGLINPYTIAAAAVAVLAVAFIQGRNEAIAYSKALILAGNTATTTSGQLSDMARNISKGVGTQGAAAEAVVAMVATGKVTADNLEQFSATAIKAQRALGQSVADTAAQFADLGKAPVATLLKLDETYHFLTADIYSQVKALELQGRAVEAGTMAQKEWNKTLGDVSSKVTENLGSLQKAWKFVSDGAKEAWDSMLNVGREESLEEKLAAVQKRLTTSAGAVGGKLPNGLTAGAETRSAAYAKDLAANLALEATLKGQIAAEKAAIAPKEAANKLREAGLKWAQDEEKYLTRVQLRDQEIDRTTRLGAVIVAADSKKQGEVDARLAAIKLRYADTYNIAIDTQIELLKRRGAVEEESAKRSMITLNADRAAGLATSLLAEFEYADKVAKIDLDALARKKALLSAELALTAAKPNSKKEQAGLSGAIAEVDAQAVTRTLQLKEDIRVLDIKDTKQGLANLADLAAARATDLQSIQSQLQAQKDANTLIGLSAVEAIKFNQSLVEEAAARKEVEAGILDTIIGRESEAAALRASATAMRALGAEQARGLSLSAGTDVAKAKELLDILVAVDNAAKQAAQGMTESFGRVGSAIGGLTTALTGYAVQQQTIAAQLASIKADPKSGADKIAQAELAATKSSAAAKVKSYADMATAAKGFFKENTAGYKVMEGAEKAFRAYEMAMAVESMVKKLFTVSAVTTATVGGEAAKAAAVQAGVATQLAADTVKGTSAAAVAVATQAQGDPYSAWVRMAAMAAAMAALGFAVGGSGGGGGQTAAEAQAAQGTGSVFGDSDAKSASIQRSLDRLAENSGGLIPINQGMLSALRSIEASMSGLANLIVRANGVTDGSNMGITTGQINIGKATDAISGVMTQVTKGLFGPGLGDSISKLINNVWGKTTKKIVDSGLQFGGSVRDLQDGEGYKQYASVDTTKSSWFGLSKKTSNSVQTAGLNNELSAQFGLIFTNLEDALTSAAIGMGIGAAQVTNVLDSLTLATTSVSLKDLKGDDLTAALNGVISKAMDEMSQAVFPEFDKFRTVGEGYAETVIRIASNYATLDAALSSIGATFGATGVASLAARERLIGLAGGIENFTALTSSFSENFLTEAERLAPVQKYVTAQLAALGYAGLNTRDDFKAAVLGLANSGALASKAGAETYAGLLGLADAFAKTTAATDDLTMSQQAIADQAKDLQTQLNELTKTETALLAIQRAGIADVNKALFDQVQAAKAVVSAKDALGKAYDREAAAAQTALDKSKSWVATLNGLNPSLALGGQSILTPEQKYAEARAQFEKTLAAANAGDTTAQSGLSAAEQAFLTASQVVNASDARYAADYARVLAANDEALKWASAQVDVQQASLDALKAQVSGLITINDSVLTVAQAIANLHSAMGTATGLGVKFDGSHAGGLANVPFDGYSAELHRGEVVVDAPAAAAMRRYFGGAPSQGGGNTDALVAEIKGLREEVKGLRADQDKQTGALIRGTVESNDKAAKTVVAGVEKSTKSDVWGKQEEYSK